MTLMMMKMIYLQLRSLPLNLKLNQLLLRKKHLSSSVIVTMKMMICLRPLRSQNLLKKLPKLRLQRKRQFWLPLTMMMMTNSSLRSLSQSKQHPQKLL